VKRVNELVPPVNLEAMSLTELDARRKQLGRDVAEVDAEMNRRLEKMHEQRSLMRGD